MAKASAKKTPPKKAKTAPAKKAPKRSLPVRILKWIGITAGVIALLLIAAGIVLSIIIDKPFIESQIEKSINRQVRIGAVHASIFSTVSGIEVTDVKISNFKTPEQIKALKTKPVSDADLFAAMKSFTFKLSFPALLKGKFVLNELMLNNPQINIVRYKSGAFNFSDLLVPKTMTAEEKAAAAKTAAKEKAEAEKKAAEEKLHPSKALSADDLPVAINVGSVGLSDGTINFTDQTSEQKVQLYKVTAKVYDIRIDPKSLASDDNVSLKIFAGIKTLSRPKSGSVQSFDIGFDITGTIIPFDRKDRTLNPEVMLKAGTPYGSITGLQIFNEMMNVEQLAKYSGKIDFLKKEITWKNGYVGIHYKNNIATLENGSIGNDEYTAAFGGKINTASMALDLNTDLTLAQKNTEKLKNQTAKLADKLIKGKARDYLKADKVAEIAVKPMLNDKGEVFLKYNIKGTADKPKPVLIQPKLGSLDDVVKAAVKDAMGNLADTAQSAAKEQGTKAAKKGKKAASKKLKSLVN